MDPFLLGKYVLNQIINLIEKVVDEIFDVLRVLVVGEEVLELFVGVEAEEEGVGRGGWPRLRVAEMLFS